MAGIFNFFRQTLFKILETMTLEGSQPIEIENSDDDCILVEQHIETIDLTGDNNDTVPIRKPLQPSNLSQLSANTLGPIRNNLSSVRPTPYNPIARPRPAAIIAPSVPTPSNSVAATTSSSPSSSLSVTCPVCLNDVQDSVATDCGHVFCELN
jgi:hypothetical protein